MTPHSRMLAPAAFQAPGDGHGPAAPSAPAGPRRVLSEPESARYTGLSVRTLQRLRAEGGGAVYVRLGGRRVGYTVDALDAWLASRSFANTSAETVAQRSEEGR